MQHLGAPFNQKISPSRGVEYFDTSSVYSRPEHLNDKEVWQQEQLIREETPPRMSWSRYANYPENSAFRARITYGYGWKSSSHPPQSSSSPLRAETNPRAHSDPIFGMDKQLADKSAKVLPYDGAPSLMPPPSSVQEIAERNTSMTHSPKMTKSGSFSKAIQKLNLIAEIATKLEEQYGESPSVPRCLLLPERIEKLCKAMREVKEEDFRSLEVSFERRVVVDTKWALITKSLINITYPLKALPSENPNRSKLIMEKMNRSLGKWQEVTDAVRVAVEGFLGEQLEIAGKTTGKGSYLMTRISKLAAEWKIEC